MKEGPFDEAKKHRILRFLHTHSHSIAMAEPEHDLTALTEGPSVLQDLLDMMKAMDSDHFAAMEQLVSLSAESVTQVTNPASSRPSVPRPRSRS